MAINKYHVPNDEHEAKIHYEARKQELLEVLAVICVRDIKAASDVSGIILNKIEELDQELESY